jgi:gas vesicle protein
MDNVSDGLSSVTKMSGMFADALKGIGELANDEAFTKIADGISTVSDVLGDVMSGAQAGAAFGPIGAIVGAAIGLITGIIGAISKYEKKLEAEAKAAQDEFNKLIVQKIEYQTAYNLLLIEQNALLEKATTIFGVDTYQRAIAAVRQLHEATDALHKATGYYPSQPKDSNEVRGGGDPVGSGNTGTGRTGSERHVRTGGDGWVEDMTGDVLLSKYPELIDESGKFNTELAKILINTKDLSDIEKAVLQSFIDLSEKAEEALKAVTDYLTSIFGELGNTISNALVDAFRNGTDAAKAFTKSVSSMLEKLAEQMIYSVLIAPILEQAQREMLAIMTNETLTDERKFEQYVAILDKLTGDVLEQQGMNNALMERYKELAAARGVKLWESDATIQSGKSGAYEAASQESITRLEGLYSSMLEHEIGIDRGVENILAGMSAALGHLKKIEQNTGSSDEHLGKIEKAIVVMKDDIAIIKRDGVKTR